MEKSLKDTIDNIQLFTSYPICFIGGESISNDSDAERALCDVVKLLHRINRSQESKPSKFFEVIDEDDFFKITLFLTERLYCLMNKE